MTARRIFLTGYMGAGKTTLGRAFAAAEGLQFVDLPAQELSAPERVGFTVVEWGGCAVHKCMQNSQR